MSDDIPSEVDTFEAVIAAIADGTRTLEAGIVVSYDPARRRAQVQPAAMRATPDGQPYPLSVLPSCPVIWPRFGNMVQIGRLNPGDEVLLAVCSRPIDGFLATGAPYPPTIKRRHSLSDAVVICGLSSDVRPITQGSLGAEFYTGREDGTAYTSIPTDIPGVIEVEGATQVRLGAAATQPVVHGTTLAAAFTAYTGAISTAFSAWALVEPPTAASNGAFLDAIGTATATLALTIANWLSAKVVTE